MLEIIGALKILAEQNWTSQQVVLLNEMNSGASDALESHGKKFAH